MDSCLVYATLESCLAQSWSRGEVNAAAYARHCAERHGLALSSVAHYVYVHDALADAAEAGALRSAERVGHIMMEEDDDEVGSLAMPV